MLRVRREYGGLVSLHLPSMKVWLVSDPALIEQVLVTDTKSYRKDRAIRFLGNEVIGQGLLSSEGDLWRRQRRLAQPAFHKERIAQYTEIMIRCAEEYIATLRPGQTRELVDDMMQLTLRIVLRALLSIEAADTTEDIRQSFSVLMPRHAVGPFMVFPILAKLPLPINRRSADAVRRLDGHVLRVIRERREGKSGTSQTDLLAMMLSARDEDGSAMSDAQLRDEVMTMFLAGHETTALLMSYSFLLLTQNPGAMAALAAELQSVLGGRVPSHSDLPALRYTEAVLLESMRLNPPAWTIGREVASDTELGGYPLAKGTQVLMSQWVLHRDPDFFPEPESFRPERWLDGLQKRLPRFAYMPFGGGPRLCIGHSFALIEATLLLASIASRFRLRVNQDPSQPMRFLLAVTLRPRDGLSARVETP
jgi:cytochrome P450